MSPFLKNVSKLFKANVVAAIVGFINTTFLANHLGPNLYGVFAFVLIYQLIFEKIVGFNSWQAVIKYGQRGIIEGEKQSIGALFYFGLFIDIVCGFLSFVLAYVCMSTMLMFLGWDSSISSYIMIYVVLLLFNFNGAPVGILRLYEKYGDISLGSVLNASLKLIGIFLGLLFNGGIMFYLCVYLISNITFQFWQLYLARKALVKSGVPMTFYWKYLNISEIYPGIWRFLFTTNLNSSIRLLSREGDDFIVAKFVTPESFGIYKLAKQYSKSLLLISDPFYQVVYPEFAKLWELGKFKELKRFIYTLVFFSLSFFVIFYGSYLLFGHMVLNFLFGKSFSNLFDILRIMFISSGIAVSTFIFTPLVLAMGRPEDGLKAMIVAIIVYLFVLLVFVERLGIAGAAWGNVVYYFVWSAFMGWFLIREWKLRA